MDIYVFADWQGMDQPLPVGTLRITRTKGRGVFAFEYDKEWIQNDLARNLDPDLQFYTGPQYLSQPKANFGVFTDSSPDRWGRELMQRREAILARRQERKPKKLFEEDYLLGVYDLHRMGGLRFKTVDSENFQHDDEGLAAPPWTSLAELEHASMEIEKDLLTDTQTLKWINMLIAPGASLGGARPKASVKDKKGQLWIAKFPSVNDTTDVGAWEMVAGELAAAAGIDMAQGMLRNFNNKKHSFLSKRFDREVSGKRIHFASAMTLLGKTDGANAAADTSYLDLAAFIMQHGAAANLDLEQLWRRIVFNIAVKNTDDHLRNHGFLLTSHGWRLSPAYDINPAYHGTGLSLNISEHDNSLDFDLARSVARHFRVADKDAVNIIDQTKIIVSNWEKYADRYGISSKEKQLVSGAFES